MRLEIETARLRLRPFREADLDALAAIRADPEVMRYIGAGLPQDRKTTRVFIEKNSVRWAARGLGLSAVEFKGRARLLGWCGLAPLEETEEVEVGYGFAREHWGQGLATEAARAALGYGFETLSLDKIAAVAYPENLASRRVMEKLGMKYRRPAFFYGVNVVYYDITRQEFLVNRES
ncbi:MAG TPA: GNAT family N-acetyltransferase [Pyrinomonadaceae bacterium]|jgi:ribosomal-protein-alanine N-acetyltransferase